MKSNTFLGSLLKLSQYQAPKTKKLMPVYSKWLSKSGMKDGKAAKQAYAQQFGAVTAEIKGMKLSTSLWGSLYNTASSPWYGGPYKNATTAYNLYVAGLVKKPTPPKKPPVTVATATEAKTLSPKELVTKYPKAYKDESSAFTAILNQQDKETGKAKTEYNKYLTSVVPKYFKTGVSGQRRDLATLQAREQIEAMRPLLGTNVADSLLNTWGGKNWTYSSPGGALSVWSANVSKGKEYGGVDIETMLDKMRDEGYEPTEREMEFLNQISQLMDNKTQENMESFNEEMAAKKTMFGRINPGAAVSKDEMIEAAKIKQERESNPPHIKQMVNRYADASSGEVADSYDDPIDQAKYEKSVGKFRQALRNLMPEQVAKDPRKRTIRKPIPGLG